MVCDERGKSTAELAYTSYVGGLGAAGPLDDRTPVAIVAKVMPAPAKKTVKSEIDHSEL